MNNINWYPGHMTKTKRQLEEQIRRKEGESILRQLRPGDYLVALTIGGRQRDSVELARHLEG